MIDDVSANVVRVEGDMNIDAGEVGKSAGEMLAQVLDVISPNRHVKVAKAKSDARLNDAAVELAIKEMEQRAEHRRKVEELRFQYNMESIHEKAAALIGDASPGKAPDEDWLTNFWDKARLISNEEMQGLWSKILAGEAASTGKFSRRTVNLVANMDKSDAELFTRFCGYNCGILDVPYYPLIFSNRDAIYQNSLIDTTALNHLEFIGLITIDSRGFSLKQNWHNINISYFGRNAFIKIPDKNSVNVPLGNVALTQSGTELAAISGSEPVDGFWEYVLEKWSHLSVQLVTE